MSLPIHSPYMFLEGVAQSKPSSTSVIPSLSSSISLSSVIPSPSVSIQSIVTVTGNDAVQPVADWVPVTK